jgi:hypothetical protein
MHSSPQPPRGLEEKQRKQAEENSRNLQPQDMASL